MKNEKTKKKKLDSRFWGVLSAILIAAFLIVLIIYLTRGEVTITGENPDDVTDASLSCESKNFVYPIIDGEEKTKKSTSINMIFSKDSVRSISLVYNLFYNTPEKIVGAEARAHADMNISFGKSGLNADAFNATYAKLSDRMKLSLYATGENFNDSAKKYFLIDSDSDPKTLDDFLKIYKQKGFVCTTKE